MRHLPIFFIIIAVAIGLITVYFSFSGMPDTDASMKLRKVESMPADLSLGREQVSYWKKYNVSFVSNLDPISINTIHSWKIQVKTTEGVPVNDAKITIIGGMPMHQHGFPTAPRVTERLGQGRYQIEGIKFNMAGWWEIKLEIDTGSDRDIVTFNLVMR